jgi:ethanolamine transporter EutH
MDDEDDERVEPADFYADPRLNYFANFLFYLAVTFIAFGLIIVCIQLFQGISSLIGGGPFDIEPEDGWLQTVLIVAGISFLIAATHSVAQLVSAWQAKEKSR